jgi:hypothetical protein
MDIESYESIVTSLRLDSTGEFYEFCLCRSASVISRSTAALLVHVVEFSRTIWGSVRLTKLFGSSASSSSINSARGFSSIKVSLSN